MKALLIAALAVAASFCSPAHADPVQIELDMQARACTKSIQNMDAAFRARDAGMPLDYALEAAQNNPMYQRFILMIYNHREIRRAQFEHEQMVWCMLRANY